MTGATSASRLSRAEQLVLVTTALGIIHHVDHVLRTDHTGWPFRPDVTPFTYSLLVYGALAAIFFGRGWPRTRIALAVLVALFPTLSHLFLETPAAQYHTWANRPDINLPGISSPVLGTLAVIITVLLSVSALMMLLAFVRSRGR